MGRRAVALACLAAALGAPAPAPASSWSETLYGARDGLPSPYVKAAAEDGAGFVWLATDGGLVRFDGSSFTTFLDAPSGRFVKAVVALPDGRVLAAGDSGVSLVETTARGATITRVAPTAEVPTRDALHYPKGLFVDSRGRAWVSEVGSVVLLHEGRPFERFAFPEEARSTSFVRSFSLAEDGRGRLWAASWPGELFVLDEAARRFARVPLPPGARRPGTTLHLAAAAPDVLWQATEAGVFELRLSAERPAVSSARRLHELPPASWITAHDGELLVAGYATGVLWSHETGVIPVSSAALVQHLLPTGTGDLLLSTDDGLVVLRRRPFASVPLLPKAAPNLSFAATPDGVHVSDGRSVYRLERDGVTLRGRRLFALPAGTSGLVGDGRRLAAAGLGRLRLIENGRPTRALDLSARGTYVVGMAETPDGSLWVSQFDARGLLRVHADGRQRSYGAAEGLTSRIAALQVAGDGTFLAGGSGRTYLFRYDGAADRFVDVSRPPDFEPPQPFDVRDVVKDRAGRIFLASTAGLLQQDERALRRVDLGPERTGLPAQSLAFTEDGRVWAATSAGLVSWHPDRGEYASYDEDAGLPSRSISSRGLLVSGGELLVATAAGLARASVASLEVHAPPAPVIEELRVDGASASLAGQPLEVPSGAWLSARAASPGGGERSFQWKLEGADVDWRPPAARPEIVLPARGAGGRRLLVRSALRGSNVWGKAAAVPLRVLPRWHATWWGLLLLATGVAAVFAVGMLIARRASHRIEERLGRLVEERTRELRAANAQLAASNAELERFAYTVSHDLKSPLVTIRGFLGFLEPSALSGDLDRLRGDVNRIRQAAERMATLLDQLLELSRVGRTRNPPERVPFAAIVREAALISEGTLRRRGVRLQVHENLPEVEGDRVRIVEVVQNLLENAAKFAGPASTPTVSVGARPGTTPVFFVQDEGIGIAPEHHDRVFGLFEKLDPATDGTGLGLAISRRIVETHGGRMWVESAGPGHGSTFCFTLPGGTAGTPPSSREEMPVVEP